MGASSRSEVGDVPLLSIHLLKRDVTLEMEGVLISLCTYRICKNPSKLVFLVVLVVFVLELLNA